MNEKILCPYCPEGVPMRMTHSGVNMRCPKCQSTSPVVNDLHTAGITSADVVRAAARRRYAPRIAQANREVGSPHA